MLAIEDSDFFQHGAIDVSSLIRAIIQNARAGEVVQGGSTITQQLVGSALGEQQFDDSVEGKLQELALAIRVEQRYSKERIFELYLNQVYMGNGVYGFGTASQFYFRKPARELSLLEGATLAGMIRAPEYFDPIDHPKKMRVRRDDVLKRMEALGWISEERLARLRAIPLQLPEDAGKLVRRRPPFFVSYLTEQIIENRSGEFTEALGTTEKARRRKLYEGGLDIHTTLEPDWQSWAEEEARKPLRVSIYSAGRFATSRRLDRDDRQPVGRDEGDPLRPELPGGHARPRDHRTSARIGVQAVRPRRRLQGGHPTDADLLELLAVVLAGTGTTRIIASRTPRAAGSVSSTCTPPPRTRSTSCSPSSSSMSERPWSRRSPSG